jgi:hypothetical protein
MYLNDVFSHKQREWTRRTLHLLVCYTDNRMNLKCCLAQSTRVDYLADLINTHGQSLNLSVFFVQITQVEYADLVVYTNNHPDCLNCLVQITQS